MAAALILTGVLQARTCDFNGDFKKQSNGNIAKWIKMGDPDNRPEFITEKESGDLSCRLSLPAGSKKICFIYAGCSLADIKAGETVKITFMVNGKGKINVCIYGYGGKYKSDRQESSDSRFIVDSEEWEEETVEIVSRRQIKKFTPAFMLLGGKEESCIFVKNIKVEIIEDEN